MLLDIEAVNSFISVINPACLLCGQRESILLFFYLCERLLCAFSFSDRVFTQCQEVFNNQSFIFGYNYTPHSKSLLLFHLLVRLWGSSLSTDPDFPGPNDLLQLILQDPKAFASQQRDVVLPTCPGSSLRPPPSGTWHTSKGRCSGGI